MTEVTPVQLSRLVYRRPELEEYDSDVTGKEETINLPYLKQHNVALPLYSQIGPKMAKLVHKMTLKKTLKK